MGQRSSPFGLPAQLSHSEDADAAKQKHYCGACNIICAFPYPAIHSLVRVTVLLRRRSQTLRTAPNPDIQARAARPSSTLAHTITSKDLPSLLSPSFVHATDYQDERY